jgi:redox-sensitive bicupin YhaK (pirin superfamily)
VHQGSTGNAGIIYPGPAQRRTGIWHSERNGSRRLQDGSEHTDPVHFAWFIFAAAERVGRASALMSVSGE